MKTTYPFARYARLGAILTLALVRPTVVRAASAPEWLQPYLTGEALSWQTRDPVVTLLSRCEVHFLAPDRCSIVVRGVTRANTREGAEHLSAAVPYNSENCKIVSLRAWVVSPKGRVISVPRTKFMDVSASANDMVWNYSRAFVYAAGRLGEPGAVLAFEYIFERPVILGEEQWGVSRVAGLFHGEFLADPAPHCKLVWHTRGESLPPPSAGATPGSLRWRVDKLKPIRGARPQGYSPTPIAASVRCISAGGAAPPPTETWESLSRWWKDVFDAKCVVTPAIQEVVRTELTEPMDRWQKIRTLCQFVQKEITYLAVTEEPDAFAGCRPHTATEVLTRHLGDCKDNVTLLISLLRAAGEDAAPALVPAGMPTAVDEGWPAQQFNHVVVALRSDATTPAGWPTVTGPDGIKYVLFDPTARSLPLGCLPPMDQGGQVLLLLPHHGGLARVTGNFSGLKPTQIRTHVAIRSDGTAQISELEDLYGTDGGIAHDTVDRLGKDQYTRTIERVVRDRVSGARKLKWTEEWDPVATHATVHIDYEVPGVLRRIGKDQMLYTPPFGGAGWALQPWETSLPGVSWLSRLSVEEKIEITLPPNVSPQELPSKLQLEASGAEIGFDYAVRDGKLVCSQRFQRPAGLYDKLGYEKIRQLVEKAGAARRRPIILAASPPSVASTNSP